MYIYTNCCPVDQVRQILLFFVDFLEQSRGSEFKTCFGALTHLIVTVIYELQETKDVIQLVAP